MKTITNIFQSAKVLLKRILNTIGILKKNKIILRELKSYSALYFLAFIFALLGAFFEGSTVGILAALLQGLTNSNEILFQTGFRFFDTFILGINAPPSERVIRISIFLLSLFCMRSVFEYFSRLFSQIIIFGTVEKLRMRSFRLLQSLALSYFDNIRLSDLSSIIFEELNHLRIVFNSFSIAVTQSLTVLAYLLAMIIISWQLTLTTFILFALLSRVLLSLSKKVREASFIVPIERKELFSIYTSFVNGIRSVHASATFDYERQRFNSASKRFFKAQLNVSRSNLIVQPLVQTLGSTLLILILLYSYIFLIKTGDLQSSALLAFLFSLLRAIPLLSSISNSISQIDSNVGTLESIKNFLCEDDKPQFIDGKVEFKELNEIVFDSVSFGYSPEEQVLFNINLTIPQGKITAFVGESGAGKTTLIDLIPRFYDPTQGKIYINGVDLRHFKIKTLRDRMAIVSQDTYIFHASARDNIAYGLDDVCDDRIYDAAKQANILDLIYSLPEGLDTILGDRGVKLSGGQRQRIAIARALIRNSDILILDEATSALDSQTESQIQESLEALLNGKTVIVIAHRLSTIRKADKVVVLEKGIILEEGGYNELLNKKGGLWKYHELQFKSEFTQ